LSDLSDDAIINKASSSSKNIKSESSKDLAKSKEKLNEAKSDIVKNNSSKDSKKDSSRDSKKDSLKDTSKDSLKDTSKDSLKDSKKDQLKDTSKDITSKDTLKDTISEESSKKQETDELMNIFIDYEKFSVDNIIFVRPLQFPKICKNISIYYKQDQQLKKQKIIIQTPKMFIPFGIKALGETNRKNYRVALSFLTLTNLCNENEMKKFYNFVSTLDMITKEVIQDNKKKWGLPDELVFRPSISRQSSDFPEHININLPHDSDY
jgi:hypothetical protein